MNHSSKKIIEIVLAALEGQKIHKTNTYTKQQLFPASWLGITNVF